MTFTVTLSHDTTEDVTFDFASADNSALDGADYTAVSGSGTIASGDTTTTITVNITDDYLKEVDENFEMNLTNLSANVDADNSDVQGIGTIQDEADDDKTDADTVFAVITGPDATTEGEVTNTFTVTLRDVDGNEVTVTNDTDVRVVFANGTSEDEDFNHDAQTFTITAGNSSQTFTVQTNEDDDFDNETFNAKIDSVEDTGEFEKLDID